MKVKYGVFNTFKELVSNTDTNIHIARLFLILNFIQLAKNQFWQLGILFNSNGVLLDYILSLVQLSSPIRVLYKMKLEIFYEALIICSAIFVNIMIIILALYYRKKRRFDEDEDYHRYQRMHKILVYWNQALPFIFLDFFLEIFLSPFICSDSNVIMHFLSKAGTNSSYCSSAVRYIMMAVSAEALILLLVFGLFNAVFFVDDSYSQSNYLAKSNNASSTFVFFLRVIVNIFGICSYYRFASVINSAIFLLLFIVYAWIIHNFHTYYRPSILAFDMGLNLFQIILCMISLAESIYLEAASKVVPSFVFFCALILGLKTSIALARWSTSHYLQARFDTDWKDSRLDKKMKLLYATFKFEREASRFGKTIKASKTQMESVGFFIKAIEDPHFFIAGFTKNENILYDPLSEQSLDIKLASFSQKLFSPTYIKHLIKVFYNYSIHAHPKSATLRHSLANFLFYELQHSYLSILECMQMKRFVSLDWRKEYQVYSLFINLSKLFRNLNKNYDNDPTKSNLDLEYLLKIETNFHKLQVSILRFLESSKDLFDYIAGEKPSLSVLEQKAHKQLHIFNAIKVVFDTISSNPRSIKLYADFLKEVMGDGKTSRLLDNKLKTLNDKLMHYKTTHQLFFDVDLMYNEDSTIITMGATRENIGRILKANFGAEKLFGYKKENLTMANIKMLMPKIIADRHDSFLNNFLETSKGEVLYQERRLFGKHKDGYIFNVSLLVKPMFDIQSNFLQFIGFLQPLGQDAEYFITDHTGLLCGLSQNACKIMKLDPNIFEKKKIYLPSIAPKSLYIYLDDIEQTKFMKKKSSVRQRTKMKRVDTDLKQISRNPEGDYIFHMYISERILDNSATLYNPDMPPDSHDKLKGNFEGSDVYKVRCSTTEFVTSDETLRLKFFLVSEIEFLYKKKTKSSIGTSVASYQTWDKMFFKRIRDSFAARTDSPLALVANAFQKNFGVDLSNGLPSPTHKLKNNIGKRKSVTQFKAAVSKVIINPDAASDHKSESPTLAPNSQPKGMSALNGHSIQVNSPRSPKKVQESPAPTADQSMISNGAMQEEKHPLLTSLSIEKNYVTQDSSHQVGSLNVQVKNSLLPTAPPHKLLNRMLSPIPSELEFSHRNLDDAENIKERPALFNKSSLLVASDSMAPSTLSLAGTKILDISHQPQWNGDNQNRPAILDNPPIETDSDIEAEAQDFFSNSKNQIDSPESQHSNNISNVTVAKISNDRSVVISESVQVKASKLKVDQTMSDSEDQFKDKSGEQTPNKSLSLGTTLKFFTDHTRVFKNLLRKKHEKRKTKGVRYGSINRILKEDKIRNFIENEGSVSSSSSKRSNTTKKFILTSIQQDYIPSAFFYFRYIFYFSFLFMVVTTIIVGFLQTQVFSSLETTYVNQMNYTDYATSISKISTSVYDLLYLKQGLYGKNTAAEQAYLSEISVKNTQVAVETLLENYFWTRKENQKYFIEDQDSNLTYLDDKILDEPQSLDLTQSIFQICNAALEIMNKLEDNLPLSSMLSQFDYILQNSHTITEHMIARATVSSMLDAIKSNKITSVLLLLFCVVFLVVLWLMGIRFVFYCYMEIQKVLILYVNIPNNDIQELRTIMGKSILFLQKEEFKYQPPMMIMTTAKINIKRFVPLVFPKLRVIAAVVFLVFLAILCYLLTMANSHIFDNSLEKILQTTYKIQGDLHEKIYYEQFLKDIFYYEKFNYHFLDTRNYTTVVALNDDIEDVFTSETDLFSQFENTFGSGTNDANVVKAILEGNLCNNSLITMNTTSAFACQDLFGGALLSGYHALLSAYTNFLERNLREVINNGTINTDYEISTYIAEIPDLLYYIESGNLILRERLKEHNFAKFKKGKQVIVLVCVLLCAFQLSVMPIIYFLFIRKLKTRLLTVRRILALIPSGTLVRNVKIKRYLQVTSGLVVT